MSPAGPRLTSQLPQKLLTWSGHVESWMDDPVSPKPLLILYEDMLADPAAMITAAVRMLDWAAGPDAIAQAVRATSFKALQARERIDGFAEMPRAGASFFRQGTAGGWKDILTPAQAGRIIDQHGAVMERLGYRL